MATPLYVTPVIVPFVFKTQTINILSEPEPTVSACVCVAELTVYPAAAASKAIII